MKFKFSLETLRKHRKNLEEIARRDHMEAKSISDRILGEIKNFYESSDNARTYIGRALDQSLVDPRLLVVADEYIERNKVRIENRKQDFRKAQTISEDKLEVLVEAARETKVLEKLKEKKLLEFKNKLKKQDRKITDEIVTQRYGRRRANET